MTALDTSVVIAAFAPWHEAHAVARRALTSDAVVPAHVVTETYAVLTRMPEPFRMDAATVAEYSRRQWHGRIVVPERGLYESLTVNAAAVGVTPQSQSIVYGLVLVVAVAAMMWRARLRVAMRAWSRRSISAMNARAAATRSAVIGPSMVTVSSRAAAFVAVNARVVPPSISRHNRAWSRPIVRVRCAVI